MRNSGPLPHDGAIGEVGRGQAAVEQRAGRRSCTRRPTARRPSRRTRCRRRSAGSSPCRPDAGQGRRAGSRARAVAVLAARVEPQDEPSRRARRREVRAGTGDLAAVVVEERHLDRRGRRTTSCCHAKSASGANWKLELLPAQRPVDPARPRGRPGRRPTCRASRRGACRCPRGRASSRGRRPTGTRSSAAARASPTAGCGRRRPSCRGACRCERLYSCTAESTRAPLFAPPYFVRFIGTLRFAVTHALSPRISRSCSVRIQPSGAASASRRCGSAVDDDVLAASRVAPVLVITPCHHASAGSPR